jgi:hypothetical protein
LQECRIDLEVVQEYSQGGRGERIVLGNVGLNLGEYVNGDGEDGKASGGTSEEGTITRRYLMRESKINSTLKISIAMKYIDGPRDFIAPTLKSAPVFGGIAGIMNNASSAVPGAQPGMPGNGLKERSSVRGDGDSDSDDSDFAQGPFPQPNFSASSRETGEMQDMYRRTLAAHLSSQPGELRADECIEDIFSGGDGWGKKGRPQPLFTGVTGGYLGSGQKGSPTQAGSGASTPNNTEGGGEGGQQSWKGRDVSGRLRDVSGQQQQQHHHHGHHAHHHNHQRQGSGSVGRGQFPTGGRGGEVSNTERRRREGVAGQLEEMDVREDLVSWRISEKAYS